MWKNCRVMKKAFFIIISFALIRFNQESRFNVSNFLCRWYFRNKQGRNESIEHMIMTGRFKVKESRLLIQSIEQSDNTIFYCTATNDQGSETLEIQLKVVAPLQVHIQPNRQTVDVGKTADLVRFLLIKITSAIFILLSKRFLLLHPQPLEMHDKWISSDSDLVVEGRATTPHRFKSSCSQ